MLGKLIHLWVCGWLLLSLLACGQPPLSHYPEATPYRPGSDRALDTVIMQLEKSYPEVQGYPTKHIFRVPTEPGSAGQYAEQLRIIDFYTREVAVQYGDAIQHEGWESAERGTARRYQDSSGKLLVTIVVQDFEDDEVILVYGSQDTDY